METKLALMMGWRGMALAVAALSASLLGCGGEPPPPAESPQNPPAEQAEQAEATPDTASDEGDVTVDDFDDPLAAYGTWADDPTYGRVWQPADDVAGADFTPYGSDGSWVLNEDGGWIFQSKWNDEWGWATYHYGTWIDHEELGWVWIPGVEWAPSWVDWRYGGGYAGWVPIGPSGYVVPENRWVFVEERHFADPGVVVSFRIAPERLHAVFTAAVALPRGGGGGGGKWSAGPSAEKIRAAGGTVRTTKASVPNRAAVHAAGRAASKKAAASGRPARSKAAPMARRGPNKGKPSEHIAAAKPRAATASRASTGSKPAEKERAEKEKPVTHNTSEKSPAEKNAEKEHPAKTENHPSAAADKAVAGHSGPEHGATPAAGHAATPPAAAAAKPKPAPAPAAKPKPAGKKK